MAGNGTHPVRMRFPGRASFGSVFCKIHGTIDSKDFDAPIYPEVDSLSEKPYCEDYKNLKEQMRRESRKAINQIKNKMTSWKISRL